MPQLQMLLQELFFIPSQHGDLTQLIFDRKCGPGASRLGVSAWLFMVAAASNMNLTVMADARNP